MNAVAVTVGPLGGEDCADVADVVEAALWFARQTSAEKLRLIAEPEEMLQLAVALATREHIPDNLVLVETGHELNDEFVAVSSDFVLKLTREQASR
ncbi:hypothetical protein HMPREF0291_10507 [Corynebacterium genitalium ATCC 33030]|uniref:Uncharacterized protein n=2 Tax=Corynebacteriaceae TaxID=1653 RepID=D7WBL8_9CORY|nr:hypothetical protein HMPREF0291_10507 [Corynebacterium genitalium ATCC 33030]MCQ4622929.1 hypothetical protein [Corynebacterium sp. CCUG 70398]